MFLHNNIEQALAITKKYFSPDEISLVKESIYDDLEETKNDVLNQLKYANNRFTSFETAKDCLCIYKENLSSGFNKDSVMQKLQEDKTVLTVKLKRNQLSLTLPDCAPMLWDCSVDDIWDAAYKNVIDMTTNISSKNICYQSTKSQGVQFVSKQNPAKEINTTDNILSTNLNTVTKKITLEKTTEKLTKESKFDSSIIKLKTGANVYQKTPAISRERIQPTSNKSNAVIDTVVPNVKPSNPDLHRFYSQVYQSNSRLGFLSALSASKGIDLQISDSVDYQLVKANIGFEIEEYENKKIAWDLLKVFHVDESVFNFRNDRECEIQNCYLRSVLYLSAFRSFAWSICEYAEINNCDLDDIPEEQLLEICEFIEANE